MMRYIIILLLISSTLTAQTKLRQIERSATKWHVPAAWDSIPGVTGHAMKYIDLETLMDTVGIQQFGIDSLDYRNDSLLIWVGGGYYFAIIPQGLMGSGDDGSVAYWQQDTIAGDTAHFWDRTNKRLGLNTKTPGALLHVKKNESSAIAIFENASSSADVVNIVSGASTSGTFPFKLTTPSATTYISGQGFLGINLSPLYPIDVSSTAGTIRLASNVTNGASGFFLNNSGQSWLFSLNGIPGISNSLNVRDVTNSRNLMTFRQATGNVGILNTNPQQQLDVNGRIRSSSLDTDNAAPSTSGTRRVVTTDGSGDLSFTNFTADSTIITQGNGITVTELPVNTYNIKADTSVLATLYDVNASKPYLTPYIVTGDTVGFILQTIKDTVEIVGASSTGGGGGGGGSGTVTSVAIANGGGISVSGSPITTSGTITLTAADQSATNEIQQIDTFQVVGSQLRLSLSGDGQSYKAVTLPSAAVNTIIASDGIKVTNASGDYTIQAKGSQYAQLTLSDALPTLSSITLNAATWTDVGFLEAESTTEVTGVIQSGTSPDYINVSVGGTCEVSYSISILASATSQLYAAVWTSNGSTQLHRTKSWTHAGSTTNDRYVSLSGSTIIPCIASESFKLQVYSNVFQSGVTFGHQRLIVKKIK